MFLSQKPLWIFSLVVLSLPSLAHAKPAISSSVNTHSIYLNEEIQYKIVIEWAKSEGLYTFAVADLPLLNLEVSQQGESQETLLKNGVAWSRKTFLYQLKPLDVGEGLIRGMVVPYVISEGSDHGELILASIKVSVHQAPTEPKKLIAMIAIPLGVILLLVGFLAWKRRQAERNAHPAALSREDRYIQELQTLSQQFEPSSSKQSLLEISHKLKAFLSEFYGCASVSATEKELLKELQTKNLPREELAVLSEMLKSLDDAKFSGEDFNKLHFSDLNDRIIRYIESKKVREVSPGG